MRFGMRREPSHQAQRCESRAACTKRVEMHQRRYRAFPDAAASRGEEDPTEHASDEAITLARLMRGVQWGGPTTP